MATDVMFVDPLSLAEFRRTLQARLAEATTLPIEVRPFHWA